jgi:hypothetical protein
VPWEQLYESCVCETNPQKLKKMIFELEDAIVFRYHDLIGEVAGSNGRSGGGASELQAVRRAAQQLRRLKIEKLGWSAAEKPSLMDEIAGRGNSVRAAWRTGVRRVQGAVLATQQAWQNWVFKSLK